MTAQAAKIRRYHRLLKRTAQLLHGGLITCAPCDWCMEIPKHQAKRLLTAINKALR